MATKPLIYYFAPALWMLSAVLAAANWYLQPGRAAAWAVSVLLLIFLGAALLFLHFRAPRREEVEAAPPSDTDWAPGIRRGILFAELIVLSSLSVKLATALRVSGDPDLGRRAMMAILGAFLMLTGNDIPKTLTPLAALRDAARVQAFQRSVGWTWVVTGMALAMIWLFLPVKLAESTTFLLVPSGMLLVGAQVVRLRRACQKAA
jgi:hypothetical protein